MASARSTPRLPMVARRARPHARTVRGRYIAFTKVRALPEWLGQCKLLQGLCVPRPPPRRRARLRRCRRGAAARACRCPACPCSGIGLSGIGLRAMRCVAVFLVGRGRAERCARARRGRPDFRAFGMGREPLGAAARWRAGTRQTPSSRRCRRRSTGRTSRHCECPRRCAPTAPPMRRRGVGRVVSARARRARLGTCVRA